MMASNISFFDDGLFDEGLIGTDSSLVVVQSQPLQSFDALQLWQFCLDELKKGISDSEFHQWLKPLKPSIEGHVLVLTAINMSFIRKIKERFLDDIQQILEVYTKGQILAELKTEKVAEKTTKKRPSFKLGVKIEESNPIEERFTFENFVKGKSNALAYNACLELSKKIGQEKNSSIDNHLVFIYGSSGLGKTHLMHAVAHRYQKAGLRYCYFTKDQFFKVTIDAMRGGDGRIDGLIKRICRADLLIVDDVHLINNKNGPKVSQLLMTLFGEFTKGDKCLILASDKPPAQMANFDGRFLSRFSSGLTAAIEPPDIETRMQILQKKASIMNMDLPKECALFIAQNIPPDVRRLEGALNQVQANAAIIGDKIDLRLVRHALKDRIEAKARAVNAENIKDVVAEYYGIAQKDLIGKKRTRTIARPRQMAMALIRELTQDSFPEIGQVFGGRDHTTVMHACEKISQLCQTDPNIQKDYQSLMATLEFA